MSRPDVLVPEGHRLRAAVGDYLARAGEGRVWHVSDEGEFRRVRLEHTPQPRA
jgi:hypothetical protein